MRFWILVAFLCHWPWAHLCADPFEKAEITRTVNLVSLLLEMKSRPAVPGDTVNGETAVRTGGDSRAELQFPDLTITRVGSNALFRFVSGGREITLDGGTMLFSSPKGAGGGKVQAGAITAAVTGTEFLISYVKGSGGKRGGAGPPLAGRVKVICLNGKVLVYFTANPRSRRSLQAGQMVDVPNEATTMPAVQNLNLGVLLATSMLGEAGGFAPLPSQAALARNAAKQGKAFAPDNALPGASNLITQASQTARAASAANKEQPPPPPPPPQFRPRLLRPLPHRHLRPCRHPHGLPRRRRPRPLRHQPGRPLHRPSPRRLRLGRHQRARELPRKLEPAPEGLSPTQQIRFRRGLP